MAPIDLNKNKDAIVKAHKEVSDPRSETNWQVLCVATPYFSGMSLLTDSLLDFRIGWPNLWLIKGKGKRRILIERYLHSKSTLPAALYSLGSGSWLARANGAAAQSAAICSTR